MTVAEFSKAVPASTTRDLRTGAEFLQGLDDGRAVYFDGERVKNVATHPAFSGAAKSSARLFDIAADPANRERMTTTSPSGEADVARLSDPPDACGPACQASGLRNVVGSVVRAYRALARSRLWIFYRFRRRS